MATDTPDHATLPVSASPMTWTTFIAQYEATGPQKPDSYFPAHFEGMSEAERDRARSMLEARAATGDTIDLDGLRLIGDAGTIARLAALGDGRDRDAPFAIGRCETLFVLTRDPRWLEPLLDRLDDRDDSDAAFAAQAIARHPLPADFAAPLAARIADGRHEVPLIWIVKAWLATRGIEIWQPAMFDAHVPFIREVTRAQPPARTALLAAWHPA